MLALFQQPLQLTVTANSAVPAFAYGIGAPVPTVATVRYKISLISELAIQKIAARSM